MTAWFANRNDNRCAFTLFSNRRHFEQFSSPIFLEQGLQKKTLASQPNIMFPDPLNRNVGFYDQESHTGLQKVKLVC